MIRRIAAVVALVAAPAAAAVADVPVDEPTAIDVERWAATATGWWAGLDDARVVGGGHLAIGFTSSVIARPIGLTSPTGEDLGSPIAHRATLTIAAAYGVTESVELDLALPMVIQDGDRLTGVGDPEALRRVTSGDIRVGGKVQLMSGPRVNVALGATVTLPTGNEGHYAGESSWILDWRGLASASLGPIGIAVGAGVRFRGDEVALSMSQVAGNELAGAIAIAWQLPAIPGVSCEWTQLRVIGEVDGVLGDKVGGERSPSPVEARAGVRGRIWRGWTVGVTAGRGLVDTVGSPAWRGVLELAWRDEPRTDRPPPRRESDDELELDEMEPEPEDEDDDE